MGTAEILLEQVKATYTPYVRIYLVQGSNNYTYTTLDRIISVQRRAEPWKEEVSIELSNKDQALSAINLSGYIVTLGLGFIISGSPDYINQPPLRVKEQVFDSSPGVLTCTLLCHGIMSQINDDKANDEYVALDTEEIKDLVEDCLDATKAVYNHCQAFTTDWSSLTLATDVNIYKPGDTFRVYLNSNRLDIVRIILENTYVYPRPKADGTIEMIRPVISGEDYAYEYELQGAHNFFVKRVAKKLTLPNYITVYGGEWDDDTQTWDWSESDYEVDSVGKYRAIKYFEVIPSITSDGQAKAAAEAILAMFQINKKNCVALVPMNCTAKLFDYVKITDKRQGDSVTGNIGYILQKWSSGEFTMEVGFGGWVTSKKLQEALYKYRRQADVAQADKWLTQSCPDTYLHVGDEICFLRFPLENGGTLFVKAYGVYDGADSCEVLVEVDGAEEWSKAGDVWQKLWLEEQAFANDTGDTVIVEFLIKNNGASPVTVNGFITYGVG